MEGRFICAVNRHHYNTEAECIDKLGGTRTEDRALRRRNSSAEFWGRDTAGIEPISAGTYILAPKRKISGAWGQSPISANLKNRSRNVIHSAEKRKPKRRALGSNPPFTVAELDHRIAIAARLPLPPLLRIRELFPQTPLYLLKVRGCQRRRTTPRSTSPST